MGGRAEARMIASSSLCSLVAASNTEWKSDLAAAGASIRNARIYTISESSPRA
jgi:hypothetical protein